MMILITGGAGFIGSNLQAALFARGCETVVVDRLRSPAKWNNLAKHPPALLLSPDALQTFLGRAPPVELIFHLAAAGRSIGQDATAADEANLEQSKFLWNWCMAHQVRFIYASSAATYGDGAKGFDDSRAIGYLEALRPLSSYGWSKHKFDLYVARTAASACRLPPQWVGIKPFNVYGPNEYHKQSMVSPVRQMYECARAGRPICLFRSDQPAIADGDHRRDFVSVDDVVAVMLWLMDTPAAQGFFNVGTGQASSYRDLAHAVCRAAGVAPRFEFMALPAALRGQYVASSKAEITRLREAGYKNSFTSLDEGIRSYVHDFLARPDPCR